MKQDAAHLKEGCQLAVVEWVQHIIRRQVFRKLRLVCSRQVRCNPIARNTLNRMTNLIRLTIDNNNFQQTTKKLSCITKIWEVSITNKLVNSKIITLCSSKNKKVHLFKKINSKLISRNNLKESQVQLSNLNKLKIRFISNYKRRQLNSTSLMDTSNLGLKVLKMCRFRSRTHPKMRQITFTSRNE